jgi:uncharacterized membrane protein
VAKKKVRRYFATGLVVLAPVALTAFALVWVFNSLDSILGKPLRLALGMDIPGLGFILLLLFVLAVGWLVHQAAGRQLLSWWNGALLKFPLTGRIYNTVSQIIQSVFGSQQKMFHRAILVPYPTDDTWAVAFVTNEDPAAISEAVGEKCVNVFVPTTPNPTSGFFLAVPLHKTRKLDMTIEDATKLVISAGAVLPGAQMGGARGLDVEKLLRTTQDQSISDFSKPEDSNG